MTVRKSTVAKSVRTIANVAEKNPKSSRRQVIFSTELCELCGTPLIAVTQGIVGKIDPVDAPYHDGRMMAGSVNGCTFCAPDSHGAAYTSDDAMLQWTEAFGTTSRVLEVRAALATAGNLWEERLAAWNALGDAPKSRGKVTKVSASSPADIRRKLLAG